MDEWKKYKRKFRKPLFKQIGKDKTSKPKGRIFAAENSETNLGQMKNKQEETMKPFRTSKIRNTKHFVLLLDGVIERNHRKREDDMQIKNANKKEQWAVNEAVKGIRFSAWAQ